LVTMYIVQRHQKKNGKTTEKTLKNISEEAHFQFFLQILGEKSHQYF